MLLQGKKKFLLIDVPNSNGASIIRGIYSARRNMEVPDWKMILISMQNSKSLSSFEGEEDNVLAGGSDDDFSWIKWWVLW